MPICSLLQQDGGYESAKIPQTYNLILRCVHDLSLKRRKVPDYDRANY